MISAQFFCSFSNDQDFPIIPLSDVTLSDHYPIYFVITWKTAILKVAKSQFFLNMSVLMHASTISHIQRVWNLEPCLHSQRGWIQWWNDVITITTQFLCIYGLQLTIFRKWAYEANTLALRKAFEALTLNPFDADLHVQLAKLCHDKQVVDNYAARGAQLKAHLHWLEVGDKASKEFFHALWARHTNVGIKKLKQGMIVLSSLPDILQAFVLHYENVFAS